MKDLDWSKSRKTFDLYLIHILSEENKYYYMKSIHKNKNKNPKIKFISFIQH